MAVHQQVVERDTEDEHLLHLLHTGATIIVGVSKTPYLVIEVGPVALPFRWTGSDHGRESGIDELGLLDVAYHRQIDAI